MRFANSFVRGAWRIRYGALPDPELLKLGMDVGQTTKDEPGQHFAPEPAGKHQRFAGPCALRASNTRARRWSAQSPQVAPHRRNRALLEDHLQYEDSDRKKREHDQNIQNPDRDPPATLLPSPVSQELIGLVGLGHVASLDGNWYGLHQYAEAGWSRCMKACVSLTWAAERLRVRSFWLKNSV
jgi:hypothetical protein